jgi:adenylate cyclase
MYGNVGGENRLDFTVVGPAVNLAFRLESLTKSLGRPLLASHTFAEAADQGMKPLGPHPIRGFSEPEEVYGLPEHDLPAAAQPS